MGQRKKHRVQPLGYVNFTKVIFRPIKRLKLIRNWCPERSAKFYSTLSREAEGEDIGVPRGGQPAQPGGSACLLSVALPTKPLCYAGYVDCKTVDRIFAYSSTHEQSNKRSGTRVKTESETWGENAFSDFFTDFEKKNDCFAVYVCKSPDFHDFKISSGCSKQINNK